MPGAGNSRLRARRRPAARGARRGRRPRSRMSPLRAYVLPGHVRRSRKRGSSSPATSSAGTLTFASSSNSGGCAAGPSPRRLAASSRASLASRVRRCSASECCAEPPLRREQRHRHPVVHERLDAVGLDAPCQQLVLAPAGLARTCIGDASARADQHQRGNACRDGARHRPARAERPSNSRASGRARGRQTRASRPGRARIARSRIAHRSRGRPSARDRAGPARSSGTRRASACERPRMLPALPV